MGIGPQHELDDVFKKKARLHQSMYREKALGVPFKDYGIEDIGIEWAPKPARDYLDGSTSFDAFVLFTQIDESKTGLGIEIKYTEGPTAPGDKEIRAINDSNSPYWVVTRKSNIYSKGVESKLKADGYR